MIFDKDFFKNIAKRQQSDIIENTENDTLYKHELDNGSGTFFNIQSDIEDEVQCEGEVQISPKIKVSVFYVKKKEAIGKIDIKNISILDENGKNKNV